MLRPRLVQDYNQVYSKTKIQVHMGVWVWKDTSVGPNGAIRKYCINTTIHFPHVDNANLLFSQFPIVGIAVAPYRRMQWAHPRPRNHPWKRKLKSGWRTIFCSTSTSPSNLIPIRITESRPTPVRCLRYAVCRRSWAQAPVWMESESREIWDTPYTKTRQVTGRRKRKSNRKVKEKV